MTGWKGRSGLLSRGGWNVELPAFSQRLHGGTGQQFRGRDYAPVPADYDGDGKADPAIYRESDGPGGMPVGQVVTRCKQERLAAGEYLPVR